MKDHNKLLGIAIPTYKRPELLYKAVMSIIENGGRDNAIPIYITDDSCDKTNENIINKLQLQYNFIYYYKNKLNLGIDENIVNCINKCDTNYCWTVGEDDVFSDESITYMLSLINKIDNSEIGFIASNYSYINNEHQTILKDNIMNIHEDMTIDSKVFLEKYIWTIGFLGGCVIDKKLWSETKNSKYIGTYFAHVGTIMESILNKKVYLSSEILVLNRAEGLNSVTWSSNAFDVFLGFNNLLHLLTESYSEATIDKAFRNAKKNYDHLSLKVLLLLRMQEGYNSEIFKKYLLNEKIYSYNYKFFAVIISILPRSVLRIFYILYKKSKNRC